MLHLNPDNLQRFLQTLVNRAHTNEHLQQEREKQRVELQHVREERKAKLANLENPWLEYNLFQNALFPRFQKSVINTLYDSLAFKGLEFGQTIVIDCSYESYMRRQEITTTANHIMSAYVSNRRNLRPFSMHLCNLSHNSKLMQQLRILNPAFEVDSAVIVHSCSYSDIFDRRNLVYISHDAKQPLQYNPNHIYILGGLVDKILGRKLCLKRARMERIKCACLPLKQYIQWKGTSYLSLNHYIDILLDVKNTRDWSKAILKHVSSRKIGHTYS